MEEHQRSTGSRNGSCTPTVSLQPCQRQVNSRVGSKRETSYRRSSGQRVTDLNTTSTRLGPFNWKWRDNDCARGRVRPACCRDARLKLSVAGSSCGFQKQRFFKLRSPDGREELFLVGDRSFCSATAQNRQSSVTCSTSAHGKRVIPQKGERKRTPTSLPHVRPYLGTKTS